MSRAGRYAIGIDIGGTACKFGVCDANGHLLAGGSVPTEVAAGPTACVERIASAARRLVEAEGIGTERIAAVGAGAPGPMVYSRGLLLNPANLPGWRDVPLRDLLSEAFGQAVVLDNDANVAAWGEFWRGAGRGTRDMVLLTLGTGVGSGVIVDGRLLRGHFENGGELGHMIVHPGGRQCGCGQRGCLETYASGAYVGRAAEAAARENEDSSLFAGLRERGELASEDVEAAAREGDQTALRVWDEACRALALAAVTIQHAFNPERLVLGGGMSAAGEMLVAGVRRQFAALTWKLAADQPEIVLATLGNDAGVIGAAGSALEADDSTGGVARAGDGHLV